MWAIVEFVPPEDAMFKKLSRGRDSLYRNLDEKVFERACRRRFSLRDSRPGRQSAARQIAPQAVPVAPQRREGPVSFPRKRPGFGRDAAFYYSLAPLFLLPVSPWGAKPHASRCSR